MFGRLRDGALSERLDETGMKTGGTVNPPVNPSGNLPAELTTTAKKIYLLLKEDGKYTYDRLSEAVGVTRETVRVSIRSLVEANLIRRVGSDKTVHWDGVKWGGTVGRDDPIAPQGKRFERNNEMKKRIANAASHFAALDSGVGVLV